MVIESTPTIYNPAAVVVTTSRTANASTTQQPSRDEGAVKVDISPQVSKESRVDAANGEVNISAQSIEAISAGRLAPTIARFEAPPELAQVADEISTTQQAQIADSDAVEPAANLDALANAAAAFEAVARLTPEQPVAIPANVEALLSSSAPSGGNATAAPAPTQDPTTAALGNTADITV